MEIDKIYEYLEEIHGLNRDGLSEDTELNFDQESLLRLEDDLVRRFGVDMRDFLWYFHCRAQSAVMAAAVYTSADQLLAYVPLSPRILLLAVETKTWPYEYPEHSLERIGSENHRAINLKVLIFFVLSFIFVGYTFGVLLGVIK